MSGTTLSPGTVFGGDFRIVRALRAGGMGAVYVVDQLSTGRQRALKVMAAELAGDAATRERFVFEARAASAVDSDHVVEIVTAGIDATSGAPFLVMELLRGEELSDACERLGPLPLGDVAEVLSQLGHALELAHAQGIVHRDLKPENVFVSASRRRDVAFTAKILDFGIAKLVEGSQRTGTQPLGTPLYMPPEQTDRRGKITPASDVWALGLITYRLLTGSDFWNEARGGSLSTLLREVVLDPIPTASERAREVGVTQYLPDGFDAWFARCVVREPEARFPEAGEQVRAFLALVPEGAPRGALTMRAEPASSTGGDIAMAATGVAMAATGEAVAATFAAPDALGATAAAPPEALPAPKPPSTPSSAQTGGSLARTAAPESVSPRAPRRSAAVLVLGVAAAGILAAGGYVATRAPAATPPSGVAATTPSPQSPSAAASTSAAAAPASCPDGMVLVPGAQTVLGARDLSADAKAKPTHEVTLSAFCLDRTEVTTRAYEQCVQRDGCERALDHVSWPGIDEASKKRFSGFCNAGKEGRGNHPINCVAWSMADRYCRKRGGRLPTEAEWEYAARGRGQRRYPWGDEPPTGKHLNACGRECVDWVRKNAPGMGTGTMFADDDGNVGTAPVGAYPAGASALGVLDLTGNVWEWTADWFGPYPESAMTDPKGPDKGTERVARGGDFLGTNIAWANPAWRFSTDPDTYNHAIGFRCAKTP